MILDYKSKKLLKTINELKNEHNIISRENGIKLSSITSMNSSKIEANLKFLSKLEYIHEFTIDATGIVVCIKLSHKGINYK